MTVPSVGHSDRFKRTRGMVAMDKFWTAIEAQLTELRDARTPDDVLRILSNERKPEECLSSGDGFFAGSGGDGTVLNSLITAGWVVKWMEWNGYYVVSAPDGAGDVTYVEGDVYRGDRSPAAPPAEPAEKSAAPEEIPAVVSKSWTVEHSDRSREVTAQVSLWICNDGYHYEAARRMIHEGGSGALADYLLGVLRKAQTQVAPLVTFGAAWQVAQDLAPNDLARRIDWDAVAHQLSD